MSRSKSTSGNAPSGRIADPFQKVWLLSTPLLSIRGLRMPSGRSGNSGDVELTGMRSSDRCTLERSYSLNVKTRRTVASASRSHVCSSDLRKSSCLLPNNSAAFGGISQKMTRQCVSSTSKVLSRRLRLECPLLSEKVQEHGSDVDSESVATGRCLHIFFLLVIMPSSLLMSAYLISFWVGLKLGTWRGWVRL